MKTAKILENLGTHRLRAPRFPKFRHLKNILDEIFRLNPLELKNMKNRKIK